MSWILITCTLLFSQLLKAQELLDTIEVSAEKRLSDFNLGSIEELSAEELDRQSTALLSESLEEINGIISSQNGGPGGRVSYFIRGTEARHVSFTIDNLKINDPSNTDRQFDSAFLTTPFLKEVTLYKGPQAVLFGSDAMGGLIDMKTRKGENAPETRLNINAGSFGTLDTSLSHDWKNKSSHQGTLTWSSFRTDGISRLNKKRFNASEKDASDITQITSSSHHQWKPKWESDFLASFLRGNSEMDEFGSDSSHAQSRNDQYLLQQRTQYEINNYSAISLRNGLSRHERNISALFFGELSYEGDSLQNELIFNHEKEMIHILLGLTHELEKFADTSLEKEVNLLSGFMQSAWKLNSLKFQLGLRLEEHSSFGIFHTGSAGLGYSFSNQQISLQYSQGYKAPSLFQLYASNFGNQDLVPERNHSWEGKWVSHLRGIKLEAALFRNNLANLITFVNGRYFNQKSFITKGVELGADFSFSKWRVRPGFVHQEFQENQEEVLRRPANQYNLRIVYFPKEILEIYTFYQAYSERFDEDENQKLVKLNGFETWEAGARLLLGKSEYGIQLKNIFNRKYEEVYGYSVMPRSIFLHYGRKF